MTKLSYAFRTDLQNLIQRHRIDDLCGKPSYTVTEYIMKQIEAYQREHIKPKNWWNDINSITDAYEKQERYHEYILRKTREENAKDE